MEKPISKSRIELLLLFALYIFILPRVYMEYDMAFWRDWAVTISRFGLGDAYNHGINYMPVYLYVLYIYDLMQGNEANIIHNINNIKIFFVFFDFLPLFILCGFRSKLLQFKIPYLFLLLNIAYVFNSMVWGQIDSMYTNLCFLAIVVGLMYPIPATLLYLLALNTKQQAIEFLPVMAIVLFFSTRSWKTAGLALILSCALQVLLIIPFVPFGGPTRLGYIVTHTVDLYNKLSICAFNIWYLIIRDNPYFVNDKDIFVVFSYKTIGLCMFAIAAAFALIPLYRTLWKLKTANILASKNTYQLTFLSTGMLCLYFFFFNSQMHERYANPIIIFFFFYGVTSGNYKLYIMASIPYFLSLDKCFPDYLPIIHYKLIFASRVIAIWYAVTVVYGSFLMYRLGWARKDGKTTDIPSEAIATAT